MSFFLGLFYASQQNRLVALKKKNMDFPNAESELFNMKRLL